MALIFQIRRNAAVMQCISDEYGDKTVPMLHVPAYWCARPAFRRKSGLLGRASLSSAALSGAALAALAATISNSFVQLPFSQTRIPPCANKYSMDVLEAEKRASKVRQGQRWLESDKSIKVQQYSAPRTSLGLSASCCALQKDSL